MKYRRLTIDQAKQGLQAGYELLAADGNVSFPSAVMHAPLNLPCSTLHRATFNHLRVKGLIRLNEAKSRIPKVVFYDRSQNWYAVWQWNGKEGL